MPLSRLQHAQWQDVARGVSLFLWCPCQVCPLLLSAILPFEIGISAVTAAFLWPHVPIMQHSERFFSLCGLLCSNGVASGTFEQEWCLTRQLLLSRFSHAGSDPEGPYMGGAAFRPSCGHHGGTPVDCTGTQQRQRDPVWVCFYWMRHIHTPYILPKMQ